MKTSKTFADFDFGPELQRAVTELGYETPTQIQLETLPILLGEATDFLGLAATGTGKTAAFGIPLLERMDPSIRGVQGLILCPTRELAKQVTEQINLLARYKKTKALAIYGGSDYGGQLRALKDGVSIVVGTPGRIIDHLERKTLNLNQLQVVVLDEADEMISMGFRDEIELILETVEQEEKHQTWLFSATMDSDIRKIAQRFLHQPQQVAVNKNTAGTAALVTQYFFRLHEDQKMGAVENLIDSVPAFYGLVFCQTKSLVVDLTQYLKADGYAADCLHGDMGQGDRERTMKSFKAKKVNVLVCTDVAARGIDVKELTHVINYSLPRETENYVHRIGRTGRAGKEGIAWNLVNPSHMGLIPRIEKLTGAKMIRATLPDEPALLKLKVGHALAKFSERSNLQPAADRIKGIVLETGWAEVLENMPKEEIVARFLAQTVKVNLVKESIHEMPRKREGSTRDERRKEFVQRTSKSFDRPFDKPYGKKFGDKKFGDKKFNDKKFSDKPFAKKSHGGGKSRPPSFGTFRQPAAR